MGELERAITDVSLEGAAIAARADGQKPNDQRWTVLTLYKRQGCKGAEGCYVAEIVGETTVPGEQRRVRRAAFDTLSAALSWGNFNQRTALYKELRHKALAWIEAGGALVGVERMGSIGDRLEPHSGPAATKGSQHRYGKVEIEMRFAAGRQALDYPHTVSVTWFNADGTVGARTSGRYETSAFGAKVVAELPENSR